MGHLFRGINLAHALRHNGDDCRFVINDDAVAIDIIKRENFPVLHTRLDDLCSGWERPIIEHQKIDVWINDRLAITTAHAHLVKQSDILLVTLDDESIGAQEADLNICALPCIFARLDLQGKQVVRGIDYLVLNPVIAALRRRHRSVERILVSMGGSDTYGVTVEVVRQLLAAEITTTVILGPNFRHRQDLDKVVNGRMTIKQHVPSLLEELAAHDLAITGGGITPFEANALGVPCLIIATEAHEEANAMFLHELGTSTYIGARQDFSIQGYIGTLDVTKMSQRGLENLPLNGCENVIREIRNTWAKQ
ncbi:MAG: glycosyl transferase [Chitinophagaceae bacterium]|nr:glycosyl transferase [Chitinophagaceae bacterium]